MSTTLNGIAVLLLVATGIGALEIRVGVDADLAGVVVAARPRFAAEPVSFVWEAGVHRLRQPLVLGAADSGTAQNPVIFSAAPGAPAVVGGGRALSGLAWTAGTGGIMSAAVPADLVTDQIFVNGEALVMARYPNWRPFAPGVKFNGSAADAISPARVARWADPVGGFVHAQHNYMWGDMSWVISQRRFLWSLGSLKRPPGAQPSDASSAIARIARGTDGSDCGLAAGPVRVSLQWRPIHGHTPARAVWTVAV